MSHTIEVSGTVIKKESLVAISSDISNNILILESAHAFPGYNGIVPEEKVPGSLFLITKALIFLLINLILVCKLFFCTVSLSILIFKKSAFLFSWVFF